MGPIVKPSGGIKILTDDVEDSPILDFGLYAETISRIILGSDPKFTIGIYGEWGIGKTSLMKQVEKRVSNDMVLTVWFNAWKYEHEDHFALLALMKTIGYAMATHEIYKEVRPVMQRAAKIITFDALRQFGSSFLSERGLDKLEKASPKTDLMEQLDEDNIYFDGMRKIEDEMKKILKKYPTSRVVIFVDDLDRCSPRTTVEIFESIKVFLGIEGFVYVVGLNHQTVIKLIEKAYEDSDIDGERYLRKIIQVPITIPEWSVKDIETFIDVLARRVDARYSNFISENKAIIAKAVELNPREVKRFINNFILASELSGSAKKDGLMIKPKELLIVQALKLRWNKFYLFFSLLSASNGVDKIRTSVRRGDAIREEIRRLCNLSKNERNEALIKMTQDADLKKDDETSMLSSFTSDSELWNFIYSHQEVIFGIKDWEIYRRAAETVNDKNIGRPLPTTRKKPYLRDRQDYFESRGAKLEKKLNETQDPKERAIIEYQLTELQVQMENYEKKRRYLLNRDY